MAQDMRVPFYTALFIFLFLFLYIKLAGPIPFFINSVQTTKTDLFHADGTGKATAVPDTAMVELAVTKTAPTVADAQNQANTIMNNIFSSLRSLGIEDKNIKTTNYSVNPEYNYNNGRQNPTGYTVTQNLEVKVKPIDKANKAIDLATANGANVVGGLQFTLDDATVKQLQQKAREEAVANAKEKAQGLAHAAGIHLGRIVDVQENNQTPYPIRFGALAAGAKSADNQPTNVTPGENEISVTVSLSYQVY